jgi:hypothetical protein
MSNVTGGMAGVGITLKAPPVKGEPPKSPAHAGFTMPPFNFSSMPPNCHHATEIT